MWISAFVWTEGVERLANGVRGAIDIAAYSGVLLARLVHRAADGASVRLRPRVRGLQNQIAWSAAPGLRTRPYGASVADQFRPEVPKLATLMDSAEEDVLT